MRLWNVVGDHDDAGASFLQTNQLLFNGLDVQPT